MEETKILLVEDEKKIADTVSKGLSELDYHVVTAYDGKIGFRLFESASFNLIITDINLPGINGYDLCKTIRSHNQHIPIIMLTAHSERSKVTAARDAGVNEFCAKPVTATELFRKVVAIVDSTRPFIKHGS